MDPNTLLAKEMKALRKQRRKAKNNKFKSIVGESKHVGKLNPQQSNRPKSRLESIPEVSNELEIHKSIKKYKVPGDSIHSTKLVFDSTIAKNKLHKCVVDMSWLPGYKDTFIAITSYFQTHLGAREYWDYFDNDRDYFAFNGLNWYHPTQVWWDDLCRSSSKGQDKEFFWFLDSESKRIEFQVGYTLNNKQFVMQTEPLFKQHQIINKIKQGTVSSLNRVFASMPVKPILLQPTIISPIIQEQVSRFVKTMRKQTIIQFETILENLSKRYESIIPEKSKIAMDIEQGIMGHSQTIREYIRSMFQVSLFLNPYSIIGEYSTLFQQRFLNGYFQMNELPIFLFREFFPTFLYSDTEIIRLEKEWNQYLDKIIPLKITEIVQQIDHTKKLKIRITIPIFPLESWLVKKSVPKTKLLDTFILRDVNGQLQFIDYQTMKQDPINVEWKTIVSHFHIPLHPIYTKQESKKNQSAIQIQSSIPSTSEFYHELVELLNQYKHTERALDFIESKQVIQSCEQCKKEMDRPIESTNDIGQRKAYCSMKCFDKEEDLESRDSNIGDELEHDMDEEDDAYNSSQSESD